MAAASLNLARLLKSSGIYALGNAINRLGGFLLLPLYTRYLSTAEYGALELLYATSSVVGAVLSVGIASATLRFYFDYEDEADRHAVISTNFLGSLGLAIPGVLLVSAVLLPLFDRFFPPQTPRWALELILVTTCLELSTQVLLAYVRARDQALLFAAISVAKLLMQCGANYYFVRVAQAGVGGVISGNLLAVSAEWSLLAFWCLRRCGLAFHWHKLMPVLRYCVPFLFTTLLGVVQTNFDRVIAGTLISLQALGLYAMAQKFARILSEFVGIPFSLAYGGFRYEMMKTEAAPQTQGRIVLYLATLLGVLGLAMIYLIDDVLRLMTDPQYWPAAQQMPFLVSATVLGVLITPVQTGILYAKQSRYIFYTNALGAACGLALAAVLAPAWGITGLAVAVMVNNGIQLLATARWAHPFLPAQYPRGPLLGLALLWVAFNLAPWLLERYAGMSPSLAQDAILWLGFVLALPATGVIPASDLMALKRRLRRGG